MNWVVSVKAESGLRTVLAEQDVGDEDSGGDGFPDDGEQASERNGMKMRREVVGEAGEPEEAIRDQRGASSTPVCGKSQHRKHQPCEQNKFPGKPGWAGLQVEAKGIVDKMDRGSEKRRAQ